MKSSEDSYRVQSIIAFFDIYDRVITRHKNTETILRKNILEDIRDETARKMIDLETPDYDSMGGPMRREYVYKLNSLCNYYDEIGILLQGVWDDFPNNFKRPIAEAMKDEVNTIWSFVNTNIALIRGPVRKKEELPSFRWLYETIVNYDG